ncbi:MAG TPA: hypothetical protein VMY43_12735 [Methanothrix sp.]|nr:hypothetical protein [Methanothrix sp.]
MTDKKDIQIRIIPTRKEFESYDLKEEPIVEEIIRGQVLPGLEGDYYRADVKIKRKADQTPEYLIAYLLRKDIYLAEIARVDLTDDFKVKKVSYNYEYSEDEEGGAEKTDFFAGKYDFVVGTPVDDIPTAKAAVEYLCNLITASGFRCLKLLGKDANLSNYKMYLATGIVGFVNVGHGNTQGIALYDGFLSYTWFQSLSNQPLKPAVVYFNSCQVHNDPLKSAIIKAGARTFIGGIVNLSIGPSEEVCKCFWNRIMNILTRMDDALRQCEKEKYHTAGAHGIAGYLGLFTKWYNDKILVRTHAKIGSQMAWALFTDSSWISIRPSSTDGVANVFKVLCMGLALNRKVDVYINDGQIEQATLK